MQFGQGYPFNDTVLEVKEVSKNVYYPPQGTVNTYHIGPNTYAFTRYSQNISGPTGGAAAFEAESVESSTAPIDASLVPVQNGDAFDTADPLTEIVSIQGGEEIRVKNSHYFRVGDSIVFGNGNSATILDISGSDLELDIASSSTGGVGADIWLDRPDVAGIPDIGAVENH